MDVPDYLNKNLPLFSARVKGAWKKTKIFQVIHGKQRIREYTAYDGSPTAHLVPTYSKFAAAVAKWQGLSDTQKRRYTSRAAKLGLKLPGYNFFISLYLRGKEGLDVGYPDPHHLSHEKGGADPVNADAGLIKGVIIDDTAKADQKVLGYDQATDRIIFLTAAGVALISLALFDPQHILTATITVNLSHAIT